MFASIQQIFIELWADNRVRAASIVAGSIIVAVIVELILRRTVLALASKTKTDLDDKIVAAIRRPVFWTVILIAVSWSVRLVVASQSARFIIYGVIESVVILAWTLASIRVANALLETMSARAKPDSFIQPRTLPVFDMLSKLLIISAAAYFAFLSWKINVSAWLASAGIVGIAVGFAARDTLANLFAGIFLLADNIYKVGDFIVLDNDQRLRGRVTRIGMRSTRILTLDDLEITVPNALVGSATVVNEVGGPREHQRIRVKVSAAYGSDMDKVLAVLASCPKEVSAVSSEPKPITRFTSFGDSGLDFELLVWITNPAARDQVISDLNVQVYKAFAAAGIEIPYSKHDVYIKEMPGARADGAAQPSAAGQKPAQEDAKGSP